MPNNANRWLRCQISGRYRGCAALAGFPLRCFGLVAVMDSCLLTSESLEHPGEAAGVLEILEPGMDEAARRQRARDIAQLGCSMQLSTEVAAGGAVLQIDFGLFDLQPRTQHVDCHTHFQS